MELEYAYEVLEDALVFFVEPVKLEEKRQVSVMRSLSLMGQLIETER